jgi:hypothetical protein
LLGPGCSVAAAPLPNPGLPPGFTQFSGSLRVAPVAGIVPPLLSDPEHLRDADRYHDIAPNESSRVGLGFQERELRRFDVGVPNTYDSGHGGNL